MPVKKSRKRRKKAGKFTPLIWLLTGILIALAISYSNTLGGLFKTNTANSTNSTNENDKKSLKNIAKDFQLFRKNRKKNSSQSVNNSPVRIRIFLAGKGDNFVKLVYDDVTIPQSQSLLRDTLERLISYEGDEENLNLVPFNTTINSISIKGGIAHIDFNENFAQNSYGLIGYKVQIYQIVYTATQFDSVDAVYFYMDGKPIEYLGGDGYTIDNPVYPFSDLPEFPI